MCCIYTSPSFNYDLNDLERIIEQLPVPYMLMGDLNAHHTLSGGTHVAKNGKTIESSSIRIAIEYDLLLTCMTSSMTLSLNLT